MTREPILFVDDEDHLRLAAEQTLQLEDLEPDCFADAAKALTHVARDFPGILVTDIRMPGMDGLTLMARALEIDPEFPVILVTGHGDVDLAVQSMRDGAYDFLEKPFNPDRMTELAKRAGQTRRLTLDNRALRRELSDGTVLMRKLIGSSPVMERLREDILDLGQADGHVLITGETGTGKTLVAHALHAVGPRAGKPLVSVACAAHDETTLGAMLFGPVGEGQDLPLVEQARGGSLLLEGVEALAQPLQARLLKTIEDMGTPAETRIVAICNASDPETGCEQALRPDLFYRLAAMRIDLPPLRARGEDILTLFNRFGEQFAEEYGTDAPQVTAQEAAQLLQAPWPGNVRQLINIAERAILQQRRGSGSIASLLMSDGDEVTTQAMGEGKPLKEYVEAFERMLIDNTMRRHRGSIASVMEELCLPRRTLNEKMAKYGLSRSDYL